MDKKLLLDAAKSALTKSYSPYSDFRVGSALLTKEGRVYTGCNIENSSYGATCCAERTALFKAVSEGDTEFRAIAIVSDSNSYTFPCGICRQVLSEFSREMEIILENADGEIVSYSLKDLFPHAFVID